MSADPREGYVIPLDPWPTSTIPIISCDPVGTLIRLNPIKTNLDWVCGPVGSHSKKAWLDLCSHKIPWHQSLCAWFMHYLRYMNSSVKKMLVPKEKRRSLYYWKSEDCLVHASELNRACLWCDVMPRFSWVFTTSPIYQRSSCAGGRQSMASHSIVMASSELSSVGCHGNYVLARAH